MAARFFKIIPICTEKTDCRHFVRLEDDNVTSGLPLIRIIWTSSNATGACWPDEIEVISSAN